MGLYRVVCLLSWLAQGLRVRQCYVERDRQGLNRLHPVYRLYLEDGRQFLLCAQKRSTSKTSNYLLTMEKTPTDRRSPLILGKLRANWVRASVSY